MTATSSLFATANSDAIGLNLRHPRERTFLEFFAGIGLTHLGLRPHGWRCIYANDIEVKKQRMYRACFSEADYYHVEDIWKTNRIVGRIPTEVADLVSASFPCIDLSLAGNLKGLDGEHSGTFYGLLKVLRSLRRDGRLPRAILVENVTGFLSSHKGKFFRIALRELAKLGYFLDAFVLDAKHFVPQSRPRLFIVGVHGALPSAEGVQVVPATASSAFWAPQSDTLLRPERLVEALAGTPLATGWLPLHLPTPPAVKHTLRQLIDTGQSEQWWDERLVRKHLAEMHLRHRAKVEELKGGKSPIIGTIYRRVRDGRSRSEIRLDGIAGCLRTPRGGSSKQIVFVAGNGKVRMRWMTPREYARLQGCPDFPIQVDRNEALLGFGDAVCVPVISWIAKNVLTQLFPSKTQLAELQETAGD
ncbi:MAG: DNA cytosine methyltransferase [Terriglobales bacterium]